MASDLGNPMKRAYLDLGEFVRGVVIDDIRWTTESRVRRATPKRLASGTVHTIYPHAPEVVGIRTADGEDALVLAPSRGGR